MSLQKSATARARFDATGIAGAGRPSGWTAPQTLSTDRDVAGPQEGAAPRGLSPFPAPDAIGDGAGFPRSATPRIVVEQADPERYWAVRDAFRDLAARAASANPFAEPGLVAAAAAANPRILVLLAWAERIEGAPPVLMGAWPLAIVRGWPFRRLTTFLNPMAYVGSPVVDSDHGTQVLRSFLAFVRTAGLPRIVELGDLYAETGHRAVLEAAFREEGVAVEVLDRRRRAKLQLRQDRQADAAAPLSAQSRKKFNQKWRRLEALGAVREDVYRGGSAVCDALEEVLALERAGWKGQRSERGRAVLLDRRKTDFLREAVRRLAGQDLVTCRALRLDGRMVAGQVLLYSGSGVATWMTAYDETLGKCSPGILLLKLTTSALVTEAGITFVDSCNAVSDGYMAEMWKDHVEIVDLAIDVSPGSGLGFRLFTAWQRGRRRARVHLRTLYHRVKRLGAAHPAA